MITNWSQIPSVGAGTLVAARKQLHLAVQLPAMAGRSYSPQDPEDNYGNLGWSQVYKSFVSHPLKPGNWQMTLDPVGLELQLLSGTQEKLAGKKLLGTDQSEALDWMKNVIAQTGADPKLLHGSLPYELPELDQSTSYGQSTHEGNEVVSKLFANTDLLLLYFQKNIEGVTEHRCWPHHFDLASLLLFGPEKEKSIGMGFSPGDEAVPLPYFYVNSWPHPTLEGIDLPSIASGGQWNTKGWVGTTLVYDTFAGKPDQQLAILDYFQSSVDALRYLMR